MGSFFGAIMSWVLEHVFGLKKVSDPSAVDLAASNATAQTELAQETARAQIVETAATARTAAAAGIVQVVTETGQPDNPSAVAAALAKRFPDDFRD